MLRATWGTSLFSTRFLQKSWGTCLDRLNVNKATVRAMRLGDRRGWQCLPGDCEAHCQMTVKTLVFHEMAECVTGMIRAAKSMAGMGLMGSCRRTFRLVAKPLIKFKFGPCPRECTIKRLRYMKTFTSDLSKVVGSLVARNYFANGNWDAEEIEVYLPGGAGDYSPAQLSRCRNLVLEGLVFAFLSKNFHVFARHHWTGDISKTISKMVRYFKR